MSIPTYEIYCDGSCLVGSPNPGAGGWAFWHKDMIVSGNQRDTNSIRMELTAVVRALFHVQRPAKLTIYTDLKQIVDFGVALENNSYDGMKPRYNQDLWALLAKRAMFHAVDWQWVRGHSDNVIHNLVDEAARLKARELYGV
ncbi:RnhA Ribonuclease HI [uncultured Caudovirales phage]|uniref:RnhA Ribonuclease HI n=1 Tax=uncultured Caudovirales phage TaxID=2100421 RepID=A0A6J5L2E8_9CAUD|nr:RnhA Ribonuclease HI [uncultured Caudovirales phage]